jgi:Spy/CpxP family protein refolding chaperone
MKLNRTLGLLLVATASVGAGAAFAAADATSTTTAASATAPAPGGRHWHRHHGGMLVGIMLRAAHQLNLTPDQQASIKSILSNARSQRQAAGTAGTNAVDWSVLANPGDPGYATALQSAKTAAAARFQNEVELQSQIYNVLTADQKAKLPQVLAEMKSKAEQRRGAWLQQHQSVPDNADGGNRS